MAKGVFIVGTDTDVGKTVVTAGLMHLLRSNGYNATYFKAALSGAFEVDNELIPGDTLIACDVSNLKEAYENITPYVYKSPVSPHLAAKIENNPIKIEVIREKYEYLKEKYDYIIAEGSGGIVCPLIDDKRGLYTLENLIKDLNMSVVIVARAGVGTINHTVLTVKYIGALGINIKGIIINNYIDNIICNDNIKMIEKLTKVPIIGRLKHIENLKDNMLQAIRMHAEKAFDLKTIEECLDQLLSEG